MSNVLVIAPHPDDETLGCGGALLRHIHSGDKVHWLIATALGVDRFSAERIEQRKLEIEAVSSAFGFSSTTQLGFETTQLDRYPIDEIVSKIGKCVTETKPEIIYLPFPGDAHTDHGIIYAAATATTKWFRYPSVKRVLCCEIISETDFGLAPDTLPFKPNSYVEISPWLNKKLEIMRLYNGEMGEHPFPRSEQAIRSLAILRGSQCGAPAAEAFMLLKEIM
jgi:LmbE family N-acetylglucosaminyl deacetylase